MRAPVHPDGIRVDIATAPFLDGASLHLFPACDPRGVLSRALAADAPPWSTRPDALVFGWMLALPPGIEAREAALSVLAVVEGGEARSWTNDQLRLLDAIRAVVGEPSEPGAETGA